MKSHSEILKACDEAAKREEAKQDARLKYVDSLDFSNIGKSWSVLNDDKEVKDD